ncbi:hypothetical protein J7T55_005681 [Diaporthe amygdali]|uniref:uncharacterized protein n=1 Tax=Phomopsis amygdali TaxID=1214568 RepID=UPI0022FDF4C6|nr:uncharacterized protein J7T55_005681 [Diaporthe amygdali]KAJ0124343.1 hypothetical protein J7T55_005681 [Diaporthe amygdali]
MALSCRVPGRYLKGLHHRPVPQLLPAISNATLRAYSEGAGAPKADSNAPEASNNNKPDSNASKPEPGPMARRLEEATEEALLMGGRAGRRAIEDAGFNEELKQRLLDKVADAKFREEHAVSLRDAGLTGNVPEAAGRGTRDLASAQPWTGTETESDAVLRMLNDAHKPLKPGLRGKPKTPSPSGTPVDMRLKKQTAVSTGRKMANAREAASVYAGMGFKDKEKGLSDKEKEAMKKELRERFSPAARAIPNTISGLAALANERIEDAIARGQFKHIPRGKGVERDARADNPFIDTTEYIMNKMIKKQEIVPPWIEKQQELVKAATVFRARLRNDWRRHAARMIASRGGTLEQQMRTAEEYARAEEVHNPRRRNSDQVAVPTNSTDDVVMVAMRQEALPVSTAEVPAPAPAATSEPEITLTKPFRDADWEAAERSYMELAINNMNTLTRAYNLMAPELAKKPYFSLERELKACFADVAPQVANEIKDRARRPSKSGQGQVGPQAGSLLDRFVMEGKSSKVYDSRAPHYGFKEFWKDLWQRSP